MRYLYFIPAVGLLGSFLPDLPYAYFQILRWITTLTSIYYVWHLTSLPKYKMSMLQRNHGSQLIILFVVIAVLFNPIVPIHMQRGTWLMFDLITGIIMAFYGFTYFMNHGHW